MLAFFPNAFSGAPDDGCEMQLCSLKPLAAEGVKVFGISHDWAFQQKAFHAKIELNYPLLCDPSRATIEEFVGTFVRAYELLQPSTLCPPFCPRIF